MEQHYLLGKFYFKLIKRWGLFYTSSIFLLGSMSIQAQNCVINAGVLNETICATDSYQLVGNVPSPINGTVHWTQISGPSVIIDSPTTPTTTVRGYKGGDTYIFRYSAVCGDGVLTYQDKTLTVQPITKSNAGANIASCPNTTGGIIATANPPTNTGETGRWSISGANGAGLTINQPNSSTTTLTLPPGSCGTTTLLWTIQGPEYAPGLRCTSTSQITVTNYGGVKPVNAGTDITLSNCYTTTQQTRLNGTFGGCNLNGQSGTWSFVSGPSTPTISNNADATTPVTGLVAGTYVFRWTVNGPCASGSDDVSVIVPPASQDVTSLSGGDETIDLCNPNVTQVTLQGETPLYAGEVVEWSQIGGATLPPGSIKSPNNPTTLVTNISEAGSPYTFVYQLKNANTGCTFTKNYIVDYKAAERSIVANNDMNIFGECGQTDFSIPLTTTGTGTNSYSILEGPDTSPLGPFPTGEINVGNQLDITFSEPGTYILEFRRTENGDLTVSCNNGFDNIAVLVSGQATPSNAGSDVSLACGVTSGPLAGVTTSATGRNFWSQLSGPNQAIIGDHFAENTTASGLISGTYIFQYITKGGGSKCPLSIDTVQMHVSSSAITTAVAGPDQTVCHNSAVRLAANQVAPGEFGTWTQISGTGTITFADIHDPNTLAKGFTTTNETYMLRWTIDYEFPGPSGCSSPTFDEVSITTDVNESPTIATAGTNACYPPGTGSITLSANNVGTLETGTWTVTPSTGVIFANANDPNTTVTLPAMSTMYTFTWTISKSVGSCSPTTDNVNVVIAEDPATAGAGPDQNVCGTQVVLDATLSVGATGTWTRVSGFGEYVFSDIHDPKATVSFTYPGPYTFQWKVDAGTCSTATDEVNILIGLPPPTANAGPDLIVCNGTSVTMAANTYMPFFEMGEWSLTSGAPNTPVIQNAENPNTVISNLVSGTYTFRWTITSNENFLCPPSYDEITVEVWAPANAGINQTQCNVDNVRLIGNANSTGTWTLTSGDPSGVVISQSPANNFVANATVVPGNSYQFTYTTDSHTFIGGSTCPATSDTVDVQIFDGASVEPNAGVDQTICTNDVGGIITMSANTAPPDVDSAEWRLIYFPTGSVASIDTPNNPATTISNLTVPGLYVFEWTFLNTSCRDLSDIVRINVYEAPSAANAGPDDIIACQQNYQTNAVAPLIGIGTWSFASPADDPSGGSVVINSPNNPQTTLSNITTLGTYVLTWTVSNGPFTNPSLCKPSSDTVSITFNDLPPAIADAGPDQKLCDVAQTTLAATPLIQGLGTWTQTQGNTVTIASPNNPNTTIFGLTPGIFEFTWTATTASNDGCSSLDTVRIEVVEQPLFTSAGPDQIVAEFSTVMMAADTPTIGTGKWTQISGPATVNFIDETSPTTQVSGMTEGIYIFQWEISNSPCSKISDTVRIQVLALADLELTKSVTPGLVSMGDTVTFSITVFNNDAGGNNSPASGVAVKDIIPSGYTLVPGTVSNAGFYNAGDLSIIWTNLAIANGGSVILTFEATVNSTGDYLNTAQVVASNQIDPDSTPNNNDPNEDDQSNVAVTIQSIDLSLQKSVSPATASVGETVAFTITVLNSGPDNATNVTVLDKLPVGYTYLNDNSTGAYNSTSGIWTIGNVANGNSAILQINAKVNASKGISSEYENIAQVQTANQKDIDSTPGNNDPTEDDQSSAAIVLANADLELVKTVLPTSASPGDTVTFTLTLKNNGPGNATGVSIEDLLPNGYNLVAGTVSNAGTYDVASSAIRWTALTLASGNSLVLTFNAILNATGNYLNTAQVTASDLPDPDSTPNNNDPTEDDQSSVQVTVVPLSADLSLTKSVVNGNLSPVIGTKITFEIIITNSGPADATGVQVTDLLPSGYKYLLFSSSAGTYNEITGLWNIGNLPKNGYENLLIDALVLPTGDYVNIAQVSASDLPDPDSTPNNNVPTEDDQASVTVTPIPPSADLSLTKTVNNPTPLVGSTVTFEVTINNAGPQTATGVQVTDLLPSGYTFLLATSSKGVYNNTTGLWNIGILPVGTSENLLINATVLSSGDYVNIAQVSASDLIDPDSTPNNNVPTEDDQASATVTPILLSADLSLTKTVNNATPLVGSTVTFEIIINNAGPQATTGVQVSDLLPSGYTFLVATSSTGVYNNATGIWNIGNLPNGASENLLIKATVLPTGDYVNIAQVSASDLPDPDSTPNNNVPTEDDQASATITPILATADLSLTKTVNNSTPLVNTNVTFEIIVTNNGPQNTTGVQVTDLLPSGYTYSFASATAGVYNSATGVWNIGALNNGSFEVLSITATVKSTGNYVNIAQVTASSLPDPNSTPNNNDPTENDQASATVTPVLESADLSLTKTVNNATPLVGNSVTFEIIITNSGPQDATGVQVTDLLPSGYTYIFASSTHGIYNSTSGLWTIGNIANGDSETLIINALVLGSGNYTNMAQVTASNLPDPDSTPNNNDPTEDDQSSVVVTPIMQYADLSLTKTVNNPTPFSGSEVVFEIIVTNSGPNTTTGVQVTDLLPPGYTFQLATASKGIYNNATGLWAVGSLMSGISENLLITAIVLPTGNYTNTAQVTASSLPDPDSTPNNNDPTEDDQASVTVTPILAMADLSLTKTVNNTTPLVGSTVTFEIIITNNGPQNVTGVQVMDLLPSGYSYVLSSISKGIYNNTTGLWSIGSLFNGVSETLLINAIVLPTGNYENIAQVSNSDLPDPNSTPNNNNPAENDQASATVVPIFAAADLSLTKTVNNPTPLVNTTVIFEIVITNSGPQTASGIQVKDMLPSGYSFIVGSSSQGIYNNSTGLWNVGTLTNGESETLLINATVLPTGNYVNTAQVSASSLPDPDSTPNNNDPTEDDQASVTVTPMLPSADLSLTKTVNTTTPIVGSQVTFEIIVTNDGPQNTTGVKVVDLLPSGFTYVSSNTTAGSYTSATGLWSVGPINNGNLELLWITATVNPSGNYTNTAQVTASALPDPDSTPNNNNPAEDDQASVTVTPTAESADLSLTKTVNNNKPIEGEQVTFEITVLNSGPQATTGVQVSDLLPSGYKYILSSTTAGIYNNTSGIWNIGALANGSSETLSIRATVLLTGNHKNVTQVIASDLPDPDSTPNNDDGDQSEDDEAAVSVEIQLTDIALSKVVNNPAPALNSLITFTITAENLGSIIATNVKINDALPSGYQFDSATTTAGEYNSSTGVWSIPSIASKTAETLNIKVKVLDINNYLNTAALASLDQIDTNEANNKATATITPSCLKVNNQFSPNNDDANQFFYIDCISSYPKNILEIYNRWGALVHKEKGYNNTWDGTWDANAGTTNPDKKLPTGTYYYILDLGDGSEKVIGWLYLKN